MPPRWGNRRGYYRPENRNPDSQNGDVQASSAGVSAVVGNNGAPAEPPRPNDRPEANDQREPSLDEIVSRMDRERLLEQDRMVQSLRLIILETITVLYREYNVRCLKHFRMRVEDAGTMEELKVAADMLLTLGRFHEVAGKVGQPE